MTVTTPSHRHVHCAYGVVALLTLAVLAPAPARADFFDGARKTFQTDIPHFFQDDIPCAFGGQPTSHTKTSCKSPDHSDKRAPAKTSDHPSPATSKTRDAGVNPSR